MAKVKTQSVPLSANQAIETYQRVLGYTKEDGKAAIPVETKKSCKRIRRAIQEHGDFEYDSEDKTLRLRFAWCPECEKKHEVEKDSSKFTCPTCEAQLHQLPEIWIPFKKKDISWLWDQIKEEISKASLVREDAIQIFAESLGYVEDFIKLTAETDIDEEDDAEDETDKGEAETG